MSAAKKKTTSAHDTMILTIITIVAGLLLGLVHAVTAGPIAVQKEATKNATMQAVFADAANFEEVTDYDADALAAALLENGLTKTQVKGIYKAFAENADELGYVVDALSKEGYGGEVEIMAGVRKAEGSYTVNNISFLALSETAGMGMKAKDADFLNQFIDLDGNQLVKYALSGKSASNEVDVISGCTVTTNAVVKALNAALTAAYSVEGGE
ncbi:MAG: FMN-binding protein [Lachnospiraceae bacterium]|nr:FMN-binding protein [Lachnospiraceae bacterium]